MNKSVYKLLVGQFLSAFADNALLFAVIAMILQAGQSESTYVPAMQASFLLAFIFLAPWVGRFADTNKKTKVLVFGNVIKGIGVLMMLVGIEPLISYATVGIGAAVYSPAKYGILPELVIRDRLVKANGWIEGSTIIAILSGALVGGILSDYAVAMVLWGCVGFYVVSSVVVLFIVSNVEVSGTEQERHIGVLNHFWHSLKKLFATPTARFSVLGVSLFWGSAVVMRLILVAWVPAILLLDKSGDVAKLNVFLGIGIVMGSLMAPLLIPIHKIRNARLAAYGMALSIFFLSFMNDFWQAGAALFMVGLCGGLFIVPINATIQDIGHHSIGSGGSVAVQNFFQNVAMLIATGLYAAAVYFKVGPVDAMMYLAFIVGFLTLLVSLHLPKYSELDSD